MFTNWRYKMILTQATALFILQPLAIQKYPQQYRQSTNQLLYLDCNTPKFSHDTKPEINSFIFMTSIFIHLYDYNHISRVNGQNNSGPQKRNTAASYEAECLGLA